MPGVAPDQCCQIELVLAPATSLATYVVERDRYRAHLKFSPKLVGLPVVLSSELREEFQI